MESDCDVIRSMPLQQRPHIEAVRCQLDAVALSQTPGLPWVRAGNCGGGRKDCGNCWALAERSCATIQGTRCVNHETVCAADQLHVSLLSLLGITTIHKCVAIRHALSAERLGVDIISIDGFECAGHPGEEDIGNWILAAKAGKVLNAPFIVSGGNGLGSQLAASLAFGASGINMGTRFMVTKECAIHPNIKKAIMAGDETATTLIMRSLNNTERVFDNEQAQTVRRIEASTPGDFSSISQLVQGALYHKSFHETGNVQDSVWSCGTVMGLIDDEPTCAELVTRIMDECRQAIAQLPVATKNTPP
eukprot:m.163521 g.163521  ORF g.163521 m.163521 type:complete len:305 (+) comp18103_c0_seq11:723-1637(+)